MTLGTYIPGVCNICHKTLPGNHIRNHLRRCIRTTLGLSVDPPDGAEFSDPATITVHVSVRAQESPHWIELGVRSDTTLHELDRFLRSIWLECCGHLSQFDIGSVVHSTMVPMPGETFLFEPMDEHEAGWQHMAFTLDEAVLPWTRFEHEFDFGHPTELALEYMAVSEGLAQALSPLQPWNGERIVVLARNQPLQSCYHCGRPAEWRVLLKSDEDEDPDDELSEWYEDQDVDDGAVHYCGECAPDDDALVVLPNSPRQGVDCYDNVHSRRTWPLGSGDSW